MLLSNVPTTITSSYEKIMNPNESVSLICPYCNESIDIIVDCTIESQSYVEDCSVCCSPIKLEIQINAEGEPSVVAAPENG